MTRQTPTPLQHLPTSVSLWGIDEYTTRVQAGEMILDAPYQRGPRWTLDQRIALMQSWLMGVPVAAAVINDRAAGGWWHTDPQSPVTYAVVDGRQRIETALAWQAGELAIPASWLPADWWHTTRDTDDGPYVTADDLHTIGKRQVNRVMDLPCVKSRVGTLAQEAAIYLLINGTGTPHSTGDVSRAHHIAHP